MNYKKDFNYLLVSLSRQMRAVVKKRTSHADLTFEQIRTLAYISRFEGISQVALTTLLEAKTMSTSKIVHALEKASLVKRLKDDTDKRAYQIHLTSKGHEAVKSIMVLSQEIFKQLTCDIPEEEIITFYNTMKKLQKNLQNLT